MKRLHCFLLLLLMTACTPLVPATTPPQLQNPPGTAISLDAERFDAGVFVVDYPDGWRVVKQSEANAPVTVTFAAANNEMTILVSEMAFSIPESTPEPGIYERYQTVTSGGNAVTLIGCAREEDREALDAIFEHVVESVVITGDTAPPSNDVAWTGCSLPET